MIFLKVHSTHLKLGVRNYGADAMDGLLNKHGRGGHLKLGVRNYRADAMDGFLNKRGGRRSVIINYKKKFYRL